MELKCPYCNYPCITEKTGKFGIYWKCENMNCQKNISPRIMRKYFGDEFK